MQFSNLLNELIKASKTQKQALSSALSYSPSEISKYLSGSRLPSISSSQELIDRCAAYFSDIFWDVGLGGGFSELFPILIPFRKQQDLEALLRMALQSAYAQSSGESAGQPEANQLITGWGDIIRTLVLSLSTAARTDRQMKVYYSFEVYLELLKRRSLPLPANTWEGQLEQHILLPGTGWANGITLADLGLFLEHWQSNHEQIHLRLYRASSAMPQQIVFMPARFALLLNTSLAQFPVGSLMRSTRYLMEYELFNSVHYQIPSSYTPDEMTAVLAEQEERFIQMTHECEGIYAFDSVSFFATEKHLASLSGDAKTKQILARAFHILNKRKIPLVVEVKAIEHFSNTGEVLVPLLGTLKLAPENSQEYMMVYSELMQNPDALKVFITRRGFPRSTILLLKDYLVVLLSLAEGAEHRALLLPRQITGHIEAELQRILESESGKVTLDLWEHYIRYLPSMRQSTEDLN